MDFIQRTEGYVYAYPFPNHPPPDPIHLILGSGWVELIWIWATLNVGREVVHLWETGHRLILLFGLDSAALRQTGPSADR